MNGECKFIFEAKQERRLGKSKEKIYFVNRATSFQPNGKKENHKLGRSYEERPSLWFSFLPFG